ncbi:MAG: transcription termination factor Rho [Ruminococcaceae bacterium]|nr:transcription termination factor Rho [Oscillospiraceae bacterium]
MDKGNLEKKSLNDLRYIAKMMNIKSPTKYKKDELIELIITSEVTDSAESAPVVQSVPASEAVVAETSDVKASEKTKKEKSAKSKKTLAKKKFDKPVAEKPAKEEKKPGKKTADRKTQTKKTAKEKTAKTLDVIAEEVATQNVPEDTEVKIPESSDVVSETVIEEKATPKKRGSKPVKKVEDVKADENEKVAEVMELLDEAVESAEAQRDAAEDESQVETEPVTATDAEVTDVVSASETPVQKEARHQNDNGKDVEGILEIMAEGYGFLRVENFVSGSKDIYVPPTLIRKYGLKTGDLVCGKCRIQKDSDRSQALMWISTVNGYSLNEHPKRRPFETLIPIYPEEKFVLEVDKKELSTRLIDLIAPIGKGQRGMIVSPPKAGKTVLLKKIANSITANYPDVELFVLLIDERPEEVTDMKESVKGTVVSSTFDELPERHIKVSELVLERAQRLVEYGKDVVILMDSITRLARAYNLTIPPTGRSLSGGLDPGALHKPKKFFGAARNIRGGGSLTIVATALVDTGSKLDDVIFEEFKGTGNMELHLDRKLSEKRIFPAIDINKSGTRREDLLLTEKELNTIFNIRRAMSNLGTADVTEILVNQLTKTENNEEFISSVKFTEKEGK